MKNSVDSFACSDTAVIVCVGSGYGIFGNRCKIISIPPTHIHTGTVVVGSGVANRVVSDRSSPICGKLITPICVSVCIVICGIKRSCRCSLVCCISICFFRQDISIVIICIHVGSVRFKIIFPCQSSKCVVGVLILDCSACICNFCNICVCTIVRKIVCFR